jgi:archaellum component FlaG (FlaF/FlaG flagellin family)
MKADSDGLFVITIVAALVLALFLLRPKTHISAMAQESSAMQTAYTIQLAMVQYARDHGGKYPDGKSSTEVFQKLIDGRYLNKPEVYFIDMPGKVRADASATRLSPENVGYDVTVSMTDNTPELVPSVFATGYRIKYKPGGSAIPLADHRRSAACQDGLPVAYANDHAYFKETSDPNGVVTNVIRTDANLGPGPYTQLTPDGPLTGN